MDNTRVNTRCGPGRQLAGSGGSTEESTHDRLAVSSSDHTPGTHSISSGERFDACAAGSLAPDLRNSDEIGVRGRSDAAPSFASPRAAAISTERRLFSQLLPLWLQQTQIFRLLNLAAPTLQQHPPSSLGKVPRKSLCAEKPPALPAQAYHWTWPNPRRYRRRRLAT